MQRESAERSRAVSPPDVSEAIERSRILHEQARTAILSFAANEDEVARIHEDLAVRYPRMREKYQQTADRAREAAERARQTLREHFPES